MENKNFYIKRVKFIKNKDNSENIINNSIHNLGIYHTQNDDDNLNSILISYNYKKTF